MFLNVFLTISILLASEKPQLLGVLQDWTTAEQYSVFNSNKEVSGPELAQVFAVEALRVVLDAEAKNQNISVKEASISRALAFETLFERKFKAKQEMPFALEQLKKYYDTHQDEVAIRKLRTLEFNQIEVKFNKKSECSLKILSAPEADVQNPERFLDSLKKDSACKGLEYRAQNQKRTFSNFDAVSKESSVEASLRSWISGSKDLSVKPKSMAFLTSSQTLLLWIPTQNIVESAAFMPLPFENPLVQKNIVRALEQQKRLRQEETLVVDFLSTHFSVVQLSKDLDPRMKDFKIWVPALFQMYGTQTMNLVFDAGVSHPVKF